jgi:hypothetical protein
MRVLLACEESQAVCKEFRLKGHDAFSADLLDCSGENPEWHIKGDVIEIINEGWDLMIAFPPCTHLAVSGSRHFEKKISDGRQQEGIDFFMKMVNAPIEKIAIENPIGIMSSKYRKPDQIIHPYYFGDSYSKSTCLWLKNLKPLIHVKESPLFPHEVTHVDRGEFVTFSSGKRMAKWYNEASGNGHLRSKTFLGIAKAMANQWG